MNTNNQKQGMASPNEHGVPDLLTEDEVVRYLRIPEISSATDYHNVIQNLIRFRDLPRIHIGKRILFPRTSILKWIESQVIPELR